MTDIAKKAGVSIATVSRVINKEKSVKLDTRERVLKIIKEYEYTPSAIGRNLSKSKTNIVAVIVPDIANPFFSEIVEVITQEADKRNLGIILFSTNESMAKQEKALNMALEQRVQGIIISVTRDSYENGSEQINKLSKKGVPIVLIDRDIKNSSFDGVFLDNIGGAYKGVENLILKGCKEIGIITGPLTSKPGRDRLRGYKNALTNHKLDIKDENIYQGDFQLDSGYREGYKIFNRKNKLDGLFVCNNQMTLGFIKVMNEKKYSIPKDIDVVSFDKIEMLDIFGINLTTVSTEVRNLGIKGIEILIEKIEDLENEKNIKEIKRIILSPEIKI